MAIEDKRLDWVLGQPLPAVVAKTQSGELNNPKRYTVKELLGSEEAMKDLLHERLLAVRDDLNFAINVKNTATADAVGKLVQPVAVLDGRMADFGQKLEKSAWEFNDRHRDIISALGLIHEELQRRWYRSVWAWVRGLWRRTLGV